MSSLPIIQAYISYSTVYAGSRNELESSFQDYNASADGCYQMNVKYSENSVQEGESITAFMDEIALARFIVLFFSKAYFESPYCLYELITAYEKQDICARSIILPIKLEQGGAEINTYTEDNIIDAWRGEGDLSQSTLDKGKDFCQKKLRELLDIENDGEVAEKLKAVYADIIKPWLDKNISEKTCDQAVQEIEQRAKQVFDNETQEFQKFILAKVKHELGMVKNLEQSWESYCGDLLTKEEIANRLMAGDYSASLLKIQAWAKAEKLVMSSAEWRIFFNRIQKIAGWFILKSINQDWWVNNLLSFTDGAKNHGFVKLCLEKKHFSYSEVVVSKALRKSAQFLLDSQNKLLPQVKEFAAREGDFVFDGSSSATLHTLLTPIVTDLRKVKPQIEGVKELLDDLLEIACTNTESFFYLVTEDYLKQLTAQQAPDDPGKNVLEVINDKLKDKLFFIVIDAETTATALQVTDNVMQAIALMENILLIDK